MRRSFIALFLLITGLAACSGGGSANYNNLPPALQQILGVTPPPTHQSQDEQVIEIANGLGSSLRDFSSYDENVSSATTTGATNACSGNAKFYAPDLKGDANSSETKYYYDPACAFLARDLVRTHASTSALTETVKQSTTLYIPQGVAVTPSAAPTTFASVDATRSSTDTITSARFDANGYPNSIAGFSSNGTGLLSLGGNVPALQTSSNLVVLPPDQNGLTLFCDDAAGYNAAGISRLAESFGWAGGVLAAGTRTVNNDGSVTWEGTSTGTGYAGATGNLKVLAGPSNVVCPAVSPAFTLLGGTAGGAYAFPLKAVLFNGQLQSLDLTNVGLPDGYALSLPLVKAQYLPGGYGFVGYLTQGSTQIAEIGFDSFGTGALYVIADRLELSIVDFQVVQR